MVDKAEKKMTYEEWKEASDRELDGVEEVTLEDLITINAQLAAGDYSCLGPDIKTEEEARQFFDEIFTAIEKKNKKWRAILKKQKKIAPNQEV